VKPPKKSGWESVLVQNTLPQTNGMNQKKFVQKDPIGTTTLKQKGRVVKAKDGQKFIKYNREGKRQSWAIHSASGTRR